MRNGGRAWMLLMCLASALVVSIAGVVYTGHSNQENNRQWCELLTPLDRAYSSTPPATELGREVARAIHGLSLRFGCEVPNGE